MASKTPPGDPLAINMARAILEDQRKRWNQGQKYRLEQYLVRYPYVAADAQAVVELVQGEAALRGQEMTPDLLDEYIKRFPRHVDTLRAVFAPPAAEEPAPPSEPPSFATVPANPNEVRGVPAQPGQEMTAMTFPAREGLSGSWTLPLQGAAPGVAGTIPPLPELPGAPPPPPEAATFATLTSPGRPPSPPAEDAEDAEPTTSPNLPQPESYVIPPTEDLRSTLPLPQAGTEDLRSTLPLPQGEVRPLVPPEEENEQTTLPSAPEVVIVAPPGLPEAATPPPEPSPPRVGPPDTSLPSPAASTALAGGGPATQLAAGSAPLTALAPSSRPVTAIAPPQAVPTEPLRGPAPLTALAPKSAPETLLARGAAPITDLSPGTAPRTALATSESTSDLVPQIPPAAPPAAPLVPPAGAQPEVPEEDSEGRTSVTYPAPPDVVPRGLGPLPSLPPTPPPPMPPYGTPDLPAWTPTPSSEPAAVLPGPPTPPPGAYPPGIVPTSPSLPGLPPPPRPVPGYEILELIGRGGTGVVYKARQLNLDRIVALKLLTPPGGVDPRHRQRFRKEAEAIARLQHPGVVQIYEVGEREGQPYLALEYVEGGSLDRRLRHSPLRPAEAARLVEILARTIHHAHLQRLLHRDLKPGNILLTREGNPKVTDFGLAHSLGQAPITGGHITGTPTYMAPEQASGDGRNIGPGTDVWALGVILYECLTGRPPFVGESPAHTLSLVVNAVPVPPRSLRADIPAELEKICLRALEKAPARRQGSALELAEELRGFLESITTPAEQPAPPPPRKPPVVVLGLGLVAAIVIAGLALTWAVLEVARRQSTRQEKDEAVRGAQQEVSQAQKRTSEAEEKARQAAALARAAQARDALLKAASALEEARRYWHSGHRLAARLTLASIPPQARGWEYRHLHRLLYGGTALRGHETAVTSLGLSSDGRTVISADAEGVVRIWDLSGGVVRSRPAFAAALRSRATLSPSGARFALARPDGTLEVLENPRRSLARWPEAARKMQALTFHDDTRLYIAGPGLLRAFDTSGKADAVVFNDPPASARELKVSPDGQFLACLEADGKIRLWETVSGKSRSLPGEWPAQAETLAWAVHKQNNFLILGSQGLIVIRPLAGSEGGFLLPGHRGRITALAASGDGRRLASGGADCIVRVWDWDSRRELASHGGHDGPVTGVALDRSGQRVASAGDKLVWVRPADSDDDSLAFTSRAGEVISLACSANGRLVMSVHEDGKVRFWDGERGTLQGEPAGVGTTCVTLGGRLAATGHEDGAVRWWDLLDRRPGAPLREHAQAVADLDFDKDGHLLASGGRDGRVFLWDAASRQLQDRLPVVGRGRCTRVRFHPSGTLLAVGNDQGEIYLYAVQRREISRKLFAAPSPIRSLAFDSSGKLLAAGAENGTIHLWSVDKNEEPRRLAGHGSAVRDLALEPDGGRLFSIGLDGTLRVWAVEPALGTYQLALAGRGTALRVTPAGVLFSGEGDGIRRRNPPPAVEPILLDGGHGDLNDVAFLPGGAQAVVAGKDRSWRSWDLATLTQPRRRLGPAPLNALLLTPDGKSLVTACDDKLLQVWELARGEAVREIKTDAQVISRLALSPRGKLAIGYNEKIQLLDFRTGKREAVFDGYAGRVAVSFSTDGNVLAYSGPNNGIGLYDLAREESLPGLQKHQQPVTSLGWKKDKTLISGGRDGVVYLWRDAALPDRSIDTGLPLWALAVSPDEQTLAVGTQFGEVLLLDLNNPGEIRARLEGHEREVTGLAFSADSRRLLSCSTDGTLLVWNLAN